MPRKIRRKSHNLFRKSHRGVKAVGTVLLCVLLVVGGYVGAEFLVRQSQLPTEDASIVSTTTSVDDTSSTVTSDTSEVSSSSSSTGEEFSSSAGDPSSDPSSEATPPPPEPEGTRAIYVPMSTLMDRSALDAFLTRAKRSGMNAVLFDLKDETGLLWYQSETPLAIQARAIDENALTKDELKDLLTYLESNGVAPIVRLYAFRDSKAPHRLTQAKILWDGDQSTTWLDNSASKGGKAWLNPYAPQAHEYVTTIATELSSLGVSTIMLDGVQFPSQTSQAYYGTSELRSMSWPEVLNYFVKGVIDAVGENCQVLHTMPGLSVIGNKTTPFGGNPVTFGAEIVAPVLLPSTLGDKLSDDGQVITDLPNNPYQTVYMAMNLVLERLNLMPEDARPEYMPWLQAQNYSAAQIRSQIQAITEICGQDASYIVYEPDGNYRWW